MTPWQLRNYSPIGCDITDGSVKLVQFRANFSSLVDAARWDLNLDVGGSDEPWQRLAEGIGRAREGRNFRGRDTVVCLSTDHLFLQNIRVPKAEGRELEKVIHQEAASRIPYPVEETEIRFLEAADIRQGDTVLREVILLACHRPILHSLLNALVQSGLRPVAMDVAPAAILRSYLSQFRRDDERNRRAMIVHLSYEGTMVVIAQGEDVLFVKYLDIGGKHFNQAIACHLGLSEMDSHALRRRFIRNDLEDDIATSLQDALRSELERFTREISMCVRYHSVTFRGRPLEHILLAGCEANQHLADSIHQKLDLECQISNPFRRLSIADSNGERHCQWDIAAGLAMRKGAS